MFRLATGLSSILLASAPLAGSAAEWIPIGIEGTPATTITYDGWHDRILVGTLEGFHAYDPTTDTWVLHDEVGSIGREVGAILTHETLPARVITGRVNAFFKGYIETSDTFDEMATFFHPIDGGLVTGLARALGDVSRYYACSWPDVVSGEFLRSLDGGETWSTISGTGQFAMTDVAEEGDDIVYLSGDAGVVRSADGGLTWSDWSEGLPSGMMAFVEVQPTAGVDDVIYTGGDAGAFMRDPNDGSWTEILSEPVRAAHAGIYLAGLPGAPVSQEVAVVTAAGRVLVTTNPGLGFVDETGDLDGLEARAIVVRGAGAPGAEAYVLTRVDGVFRAPWDPAIIGVGDPAVPPPARMSIRPNPARRTATITFAIDESGRVAIDVHDAAGRRVDTVYEGQIAKGTHEVVWNLAALEPGVYFARVVPGGVVRRVVVTR